MEKEIIIIAGCFVMLGVGIFSSLFEREGAWFSNVLNVVGISLLSFLALFMGETNVAGIIVIDHTNNMALALVGFFTVVLIFYGDLASQKESQVVGLHSFVFLISYVLLGTRDWINVFICYKLVALAYYSLLDAKDGKLSKPLLVFEMLRSTMLMSAIMFYFLGTGTFSFYQPMIVNQDFFLISLIFFSLFTAMELGLLPFHFWFGDFLMQGKKDGRIFFALIRKIIFSYFMIVVLEGLSVMSGPEHGEIFASIVKGYVLINIVMGSFFLLVQRNMVAVVSSFGMLNMSLAFLCVTLEEGIFSKGHLLFYLFCTLLPLLGMSLINNAVCVEKSDDYSLKKFCAVVARNRWSRTYFSIFLLAIVGFPLTMGLPGRVPLYLDLLERMDTGLFVGLIFMLFSSMQTGFKIVGYVFSRIGEKGGNVILGKKHLWIHAVLVFLVMVVGIFPSLILNDA